MKNNSKKVFLDELEKISIVQVACERAGISRNTAYRWRKKDREFRIAMNEAMREGSSVLNDLAEATIVKKVRDGHVGASMFWLRNRNPRFGAQPSSTYEAFSKIERLIEFVIEGEAAQMVGDEEVPKDE